jgi:hypothetical protein
MITPTIPWQLMMLLTLTLTLTLTLILPLILTVIFLISRIFNNGQTLSDDYAYDSLSTLNATNPDPNPDPNPNPNPNSTPNSNPIIGFFDNGQTLSDDYTYDSLSTLNATKMIQNNDFSKAVVIQASQVTTILTLSYPNLFILHIPFPYIPSARHSSTLIY